MGKVEDATNTMIRNLEEKTGKSLVAWTSLLQKEKLEKHSARIAFLKSQHGMGHGYANLIANTLARGDTPATGAGLMDAQYHGAKAALRPICDDILAEVRNFGGDVEVAPKKTYASLRRSRQFAIVQPSTATRLDVGVNLKGVAPAGRLELSGSFSAMVSHRIRIESRRCVDKELIGWLRQAYDEA